MGGWTFVFGSPFKSHQNRVIPIPSHLSTTPLLEQRNTTTQQTEKLSSLLFPTPKKPCNMSEWTKCPSELPLTSALGKNQPQYLHPKLHAASEGHLLVRLKGAPGPRVHLREPWAGARLPKTRSIAIGQHACDKHGFCTRSQESEVMGWVLGCQNSPLVVLGEKSQTLQASLSLLLSSSLRLFSLPPSLSLSLSLALWRIHWSKQMKQLNEPPATQPNGQPRICQHSRCRKQNEEPGTGLRFPQPSANRSSRIEEIPHSLSFLVPSPFRTKETRLPPPRGKRRGHGSGPQTEPEPATAPAHRDRHGAVQRRRAHGCPASTRCVKLWVSKRTLGLPKIRTLLETNLSRHI